MHALARSHPMAAELGHQLLTVRRHDYVPAIS
jgi:hypothetical protein